MNKFDIKILNSYVKGKGFCVEKHPNADLFIYGYSNNNSIKWDDYSLNIRGLILDGNGNIKARSFPKFFTYRSYLSDNTLLLSNNQILDIPSSDFKIFEKIDGSLGILYWVEDRPYIATQRSFTSKKAIIANTLLYKKYSQFFKHLKKDRTYLFEVISAETKVIVDYKQQDVLCLIGIIDNESGRQLPLEDIGFPLVKDHSARFSFITNFTDLQNLNIPNMEGFVILFENNIRFKIKFPWYSSVHRLIDQLIYLERAKYSINKKIKANFNMDFNYISNIDWIFHTS